MRLRRDVRAAEDYTQGVEVIIKSLGERKFEICRIKNFWGPGDGYQVC